MTFPNAGASPGCAPANGSLLHAQLDSRASASAFSCRFLRSSLCLRAVERALACSFSAFLRAASSSFAVFTTEFSSSKSLDSFICPSPWKPCVSGFEDSCLAGSSTRALIRATAVCFGLPICDSCQNSTYGTWSAARVRHEHEVGSHRAAGSAHTGRSVGDCWFPYRIFACQHYRRDNRVRRRRIERSSPVARASLSALPSR